MKYDPNDKIQLQSAKSYFNMLCNSLKPFELKAIVGSKSHQQRKYLHVIIDIFAIYVGHKRNHVKSFFKSECGFMDVEILGRTETKSTEELNEEEYSKLIDFIRQYSDDNGKYIPTNLEYLEAKNYIDNEIEMNERYL